MRATRWLIAVALLLAAVRAVAVSAADEAPIPPHVLLVSIPLPGHLNPLIAQGMELRRRGWTVTLASPTRLKHHVEAAQVRAAKESNGTQGQTLAPLRYMDLGGCAAISDLTDTLVRAASCEDYMESAREMLQWSLSLHHCMYSSLLVQVPQMPVRPAVLVSDFATYAGFDIADRFGIPLVINNPDLLNMLSPDDVAPHDFIPGTMTATSITEHGSAERWYGLMARAIYPPVRVILRYIMALTVEADLHAQQALSGIAPTHLLSRMNGRLLLVNSAFGLEYARPLPPNVVMVGHQADKQWRNDLQQARDEFEAVLSEEDRQWLADGSDLPVIWVSMGTISPLNERQIMQLYSAFERGTAAGHFRVLWKIEPNDQRFLPAESSRPLSSRLRLVRWVSSQLGVLAHPATRVFVSHCGINSVHESVYLEKPLLCIPILADQADMAMRVLDSGVGLHLSKSRFTAEEMLDTLTAMLHPVNAVPRAAALHRTRASMLLSGGVVRAVNYIEYAARFGVATLVPVEVSLPWWVRHHIDVYAVWTISLLLLWVAVRACCCRCCCPGKECTKDRKKANRNARGLKDD